MTFGGPWTLDYSCCGACLQHAVNLISGVYDVRPQRHYENYSQHDCNFFFVNFPAFIGFHIKFPFGAIFYKGVILVGGRTSSKALGLSF